MNGDEESSEKKPDCHFATEQEVLSLKSKRSSSSDSLQNGSKLTNQGMLREQPSSSLPQITKSSSGSSPSTGTKKRKRATRFSLPLQTNRDRKTFATPISTTDNGEKLCLMSSSSPQEGEELVASTPNPLLASNNNLVESSIASSAVAAAAVPSLNHPIPTNGNPLLQTAPSAPLVTSPSTEQTASYAAKAVPLVSNEGFTREEHRAFVSAIFDIGLKESSPLSVLDHMSEKFKTQYEGALNLERLKSKLQKYRMKKNRSKEDFMVSYDETMSEFLNMLPLAQQRGNHGNILPPIESLSSGAVPAALTFSVMLEQTEMAKRKMMKQNPQTSHCSSTHLSARHTDNHECLSTSTNNHESMKTSHCSSTHLSARHTDNHECLSTSTNNHESMKSNQHEEDSSLSGLHVLDQKDTKVGPAGKSCEEEEDEDEQGNNSSGLKQLILAASQEEGEGATASCMKNDDDSEMNNNDSPISSLLSLPKLTNAEISSPIGRSLIYFMGLFKSLEEELVANRMEKMIHRKDGNDKK
eukprot:CAMPEP_0203682936 /NCGR_PEP_ID=MMETSP0090-20130426/47258_1 /ASSEMBLY_ACC=CAM_ASM_001088 /TAXON_ID=426623 /ORGANISM="Chaetoceros affinis, Strain CCMP159" /LENGTH=525 /DNA_ID=CAMNT_0050552053 /DNA_START=145 /DNA_END=1722 /DNA_ORIENTATION=-